MPIGNYGVNIQRVGLINNIKKEDKEEEEEQEQEVEEVQEQEQEQKQKQEQQFIQIQKR